MKTRAPHKSNFLKQGLIRSMGSTTADKVAFVTGLTGTTSLETLSAILLPVVSMALGCQIP
jgi:hypothetical protein